MFEKLSEELDQTKKQVQQLTDELKDAKNKLHQLVYRDGLSGLYNQRYFQEMIRKELERSTRYSSPFSLLIFDLDSLSELNETYGNNNGDLVLMNTARIVEQEVRPSDIVARYSGDNFAVILPETDQAGAKLFAERLCQSVREMATLIDGKEVKTSISIGGSTFVPNTGQSSKRDLLLATEQALAEAKAKGPGQIEIIGVS